MSGRKGFIRRFLLLPILAGVFPLAGYSAEVPKAAAPLILLAKQEFETMKTTLYQHKTQVNREAGDYRFDCVGFVSHALRQATPQAWASTVKATKLAKGRIPSPSLYRKFLADLAANPQPGWEAVGKVSDLRPGDVVAWEFKTERSSGHAVIVGTAPVRAEDGSWTVEVYDSTSSWHGNDSRPQDPRAQVLEITGRRSGLGHGIIGLVADPASGALTGYRWSPKAKTITAPIAAGRPKS